MSRLLPFPKLHDIYVGKVLLGTVLMTWAVLLGLDLVLGGLMTELDDIGQGDYGFAEALLYILYTVPRRDRPSARSAVSSEVVASWPSPISVPITAAVGNRV